MLAELLTLSHVPRWAIIDTTKAQTVADHSFRVAAICLTLVEELRKIEVTVDRETVLLGAILHDMGECKSGDIPTPYKKKLAAWGFSDGDHDPTREQLVIKIADTLEAIIFVDRYVIRPDKIRPGLVESLHHTTDNLHDTMAKIPRGWLNRIIDKILEDGANYE